MDGIARIEQIGPGQLAVEAEGGADQAWSRGQPVDGGALEARPDPLEIFRARRAMAVPFGLEAGGPEQVDALQRLDGTDQHGVGDARRLGDDVEAVVHAVHKINVGPAGLAVHRPAAGRLAEAGVRGAIGRAQVRLDLDDPANPSGPPAASAIFAHEAGPEQAPGDLEGGPLEDDPQINRRHEPLRTSGRCSGCRPGSPSRTARRRPESANPGRRRPCPSC